MIATTSQQRPIVSDLKLWLYDTQTYLASWTKMFNVKTPVRDGPLLCDIPQYLLLTRHKKCDRCQPVCERCTRGGFECLEYEQTSSSGSSLIPGGSSQLEEAVDEDITCPRSSLPLQFPGHARSVVDNGWMMFYPLASSSQEVRSTVIMYRFE